METQRLRTPLLCLAALLAVVCMAQPNTWSSLAPYGSYPRANAVAFSLNGYGFMVTGSYFAGQPHETDQLWRYDPSMDMWAERAYFGGGGCSGAAAFTLGNIGYVVCGDHAGTYTNALWAYDPISNTWDARAPLPAAERAFAVAFSIGDKGYVGLGEDANGNALDDLWEYDPVSDTWTARATFPAGATAYASGFSAAGLGYVVFGGELNTWSNGLWAYDPIGDSWTPRASFPGLGRHFAIAFGLNGHGFAGTGLDANGIFNDFAEYDPQTDAWTLRADLPADARSAATAFTLGTSGYLVGGRGPFFTLEQDLWRYDPVIATGMQEEQRPSITLFPDPAHDDIHWSDGSNADVEVIDAQGQRVINTRTAAGRAGLDLTRLHPGTYLLRMRDRDGWRNTRFLKD